MQLNSSGNEIRPQGSVPQFHEELRRLDHRDLVNSQEGMKHTTTTSSSLQGTISTARTRIALVEVPSLLTHLSKQG